MNRIRMESLSRGWARVGINIFQGAALALVLAIALPARASDDRAIKSRVAPVYPEMAKRMKISGTVRLEATVDALGKVTEVKAISGNRLLSIAAEDAVMKWKFVPGTGDSSVNVEVNFTPSQ